jgi:spore germination cell wall hydrolase CwlJ-like protein
MIKPILIASIATAIYVGTPVKADKVYNQVGAAELTNKAQIILFDKIEEFKVDNVSDLVCLAENIYFESRAESIEGKAAVANVTRNRVKDKRWPETYCKVVQQGPLRESWKTKLTVSTTDAIYYPVKNRCQFSWYCDGKADKIWANMEETGKTIKDNAKAWSDALTVSAWTLGYGDYIDLRDNTDGSVFYYNHNLVNPSWAGSYTWVITIGNHTFLR